MRTKKKKKKRKFVPKPGMVYLTTQKPSWNFYKIYEFFWHIGLFC